MEWDGIGITGSIDGGKYVESSAQFFTVEELDIIRVSSLRYPIILIHIRRGIQIKNTLLPSNAMLC